ncbi:MAG: PAS domain S-box protein [Desulfobacterium sp.]|nr:PAS domain S-box protein [Desulfobacterium sp.]
MTNSIYGGRQRILFNIILGTGVFFSLYVINQYNYLIYHTISELFTVVIAWSFFIIVWNTKNIIKSDVIVFLGVAYLFIGGIDILHAFSYKGMNLIVGADAGANPATQLWIYARYMESITLAIVPFLLLKKINVSSSVVIYGTLFFFAICSILVWDIFPDCYITGSGLTSFKRYSEYTIIGLLAISLYALSHRVNLIGKKIYVVIAPAIVLKIFSELSFTFYVDIYGLLNFVGHALKIFSFYLMYVALIRFGLSEPYRVLFKGLTESEKRYRQMFNTNTSVKLIISPHTGAIVEVNQAACDFYGYTKAELLSLNINEINILSPDEIQCEMEQAKKEKKLYFNFSHQLKSGEIRDVEVYSGPVKQNNDTYLYSIIHDVTGKKKNEDSLKFQSLLLNKIQDHITATDLEGNILFVNEAEVKTTKHRKEDLLGKSVSIYGEDPSKGSTQNAIIKGTLENGFWNGEVVNYTADGTELIMFCRTKLIKDKNNQPWRMVGISTDITKQKQVEHALRESEDKFKTMFDKAPLSYQSLDKNGNFLEINNTWLQIMGYERDEVIGKNFSVFLPPDWKEHFQINFPRFKAVGEVLGVQFEMVKKNGQLILVSFHGKIAYDTNDQFKQTHCIFRDITQEDLLLKDKKKLECQLRHIVDPNVKTVFHST